MKRCGAEWDGMEIKSSKLGDGEKTAKAHIADATVKDSADNRRRPILARCKRAI